MSLTLARRLVKSQPWLDRLADRIQPVVRDLLDPHQRLHDLLDGTWLGVPLHPALTDVPVGSWVTAFVLDTVAGFTASPEARRAADATLAVGTVAAVPTALTGIGDWRDLGRRTERRRIATLHGVLNAVGLTLAIASVAQRARGRRAGGVALSATGLAFSGLAAHLGGELSFGLGTRVNLSNFIARAGPADFTPVLKEHDLTADAMRTVDLAGGPVLVTLDRSGRPCAIASTCSHYGGPLAEGQRTGDVVTCPLHGSRFDVCTGRVVEGPAVFPQQTYEVRVRNGEVEVRLPAPDTGHQPTGKGSGEGDQAAAEL